MGNDAARAILAVATAPPQKSGGAVAALWFFLAGLGGPWWYLGRPGSAVAALLLYWTCGALVVVGVGLVLLPVLWVIDALALSSSLRQYNQNRQRILETALASAG